MKAYIVYFSGTGNTKYVAETFKKNFEYKDIKAELINIEKEESIKYDGDYYVFACPTHIEVCPSIFVQWIKKIKKVVQKKCIVVSTQAAKSSSVPRQISRILARKGFRIIVRDCIVMPNNFYVVSFKENTKDEIENLKNTAKDNIESITTEFLQENVSKKGANEFRLALGKITYKALEKIYLKRWAKKKLTVDYNKCISCGKCEEVCPTGNIKMNEGKISFEDKCLCCQRCIHSCPSNAFMYKQKHFTQYKL